MRKIFILLLASICFSVFAQVPQGYYNSAEGKTGAELKTSLYQIIKNHNALSYGDLWGAFQNTDKKPNGKVWDMYSDVPEGVPPYEYTFGTNQCGNYSKEGDCYNREHSVPESWFNKENPMRTDLFHLYPTDGYVNNKRDNYPYGEVKNASWTSRNGSKLGSSNMTGYTKTVFEPIDEYKGDFARTYFYMVTRYEDKVSTWNSDMFNKTAYPSFTDWSITILLKWHRQDPVSEKEIARNNAVYQYQHNRNPFIDRPEFAECIWADCEPSVINKELFENEDIEIVIETITKKMIISVKREILKLEIYSLTGQKVISQTSEYAHTETVDIFAMQKGIYIVKIYLVDKVISKKIVLLL